MLTELIMTNEFTDDELINEMTSLIFAVSFFFITISDILHRTMG